MVCEPGVVLDELNERLADFGRKIGPDPSSGNRATVGGCVANNATGAHSLEYGYIGDYVKGIEAVLADGSVVEFRNDFDPAEEAEPRAGEIAKECFSVLSEGEDVIKRAFDSLPEKQRTALVLCQYHGMSYHEIASIEKVPVGTVKSRIHNGLSKVRDFLKEREVV